MSDTTEPWLVLDVDGVISPMGASDAWPDFRPVRRAPYRLRISRAMGDALADIPARRLWLTTWDDAANEWVAPALGWDPLPVVERLELAGHYGTEAKLLGLTARLGGAETVPAAVLWCEDGLAEPGLRRSAASRLGDVPHRLIAPDPRQGLTPDHVSALLETARGAPT